MFYNVVRIWDEYFPTRLAHEGGMSLSDEARWDMYQILTEYKHKTQQRIITGTIYMYIRFPRLVR